MQTSQLISEMQNQKKLHDTASQALDAAINAQTAFASPAPLTPPAGQPVPHIGAATAQEVVFPAQ